MSAGTIETPITVAVLDAGGGQETAAIIGSERALKLVAIAADPDVLRERLAEQPASVVLVDVRGLASDTLVSLVVKLGDTTSVVVLGEPADASLLSRAVRAGARSLLVRPYEAEELVSVIREVAQRSDTRTPATAGGSAIVTAVYSPKGGAGATTVATALAVALAESRAGRVGIVDLDLRFGGVGIALDLRAQNTIVDVLARPGPLDGAIVDDIFVTHGSGLKVLLAPETLGLADAVSPDAIGRLVQTLRPHFDHLVLDLPTSFDDVAMAALRAADRVLLVTTPELPALRDLQRVMTSAPDLRNGRSHVILNRWPSRAGVPLADVERALGRKVALSLPSEGAAVTRALNTGLSLLDRRAGVKSASRFRDLARLVTANGGGQR
jgi:pilus assembly protein CpaE